MNIQWETQLLGRLMVDEDGRRLGRLTTAYVTCTPDLYDVVWPRHACVYAVAVGHVRLRSRVRGGVMATPIDRERVRQLINQGAQLVEVLPPAEYADEHLPGAISIPLKELDRDRVRGLDPDRPVVVYCYDDP